MWSLHRGGLCTKVVFRGGLYTNVVLEGGHNKRFYPNPSFASSFDYFYFPFSVSGFRFHCFQLLCYRTLQWDNPQE